MIEVQAAQVTFGRGTPMENHAIRGIDLKIPEGQFVTVIGSNGAGKSTLLNLIAGEITIDSGNILLDDEDVTRWPVNKRAKHIARVFQDPLTGTCEDLTIEENLALAYARSRSRGLQLATQARYKEQFTEVLTRLQLGLEDRFADKVGLLSGGQRQSLSLIMATLNPMKLLLLDEHTAALDPKTAKFILELTQSIVDDKQLTTLMVTHSMKQALSMGNRIIMLHEGRIILDVSGDERAKLTTEDLLQCFHQTTAEISDSALLEN